MAVNRNKFSFVSCIVSGTNKGKMLCTHQRVGRMPKHFYTTAIGLHNGIRRCLKQKEGHYICRTY
jgi:hypothetical protein